MKKIFFIIVLVLVIAGVFLFLYPVNEQKSPVAYSSEKYGLSFDYPKNYFVALEKSLDGEREQHAIVLAEDVPAVRELFSNPNSATEGPPAITITIFQNNLDNYTLQSFVERTNFSNFKLSNGNKTEITIGGQPAWRYRATGLYENDNVVVARPEYVYMFTVFFNSPDDQIIKDFDEILKTLKFSEPEFSESEPVGILPFKSGVEGVVLLGPTCPVVKNPPDPNCADKPYQTTVQIIAVGSPKSSPFAMAMTDKEGRYKIMLPPGEYGLQAIGGQPFPSCEWQSVIIKPDVMTKIDLSCDTGIR